MPAHCDDFAQNLAAGVGGQTSYAVTVAINRAIALNRSIHEADCINLNPATNVMNPKAEAALASGLGSRPSLGYPGDKYEMGLEGVEKIEVIAAELAAEVFGARYAEIRVPSGAIANLYAFMVAAKAGRLHHRAAGVDRRPCHAPSGRLRRPVRHRDPRRSGRCRRLHRGCGRLCAHWRTRSRPKMITIGSSLNLLPHPIREIRTIADEVGALVLFDAAHLCGMIAGHAWQQPLEEGAHLMTMSTYKSLGGPPSGLIVTNDADIAEKLDAIAFPGMTANFDAAKSASLAITLLDWKSPRQGLRGGDGAKPRQRLPRTWRSAACRSSRPQRRLHHVAPIRAGSRASSAADRRLQRNCAEPTC